MERGNLFVMFLYKGFLHYAALRSEWKCASISTAGEISYSKISYN